MFFFDTDKNVNVSDLVAQPRPSPSNSKELVQNGAQRTTTCHVNTEDTGIGLQDIKLDGRNIIHWHRCDVR